MISSKANIVCSDQSVFVRPHNTFGVTAVTILCFFQIFSKNLSFETVVHIGIWRTLWGINLSQKLSGLGEKSTDETCWDTL